MREGKKKRLTCLTVEKFLQQFTMLGGLEALDGIKLLWRHVRYGQSEVKPLSCGVATFFDQDVAWDLEHLLRLLRQLEASAKSRFHFLREASHFHLRLVPMPH